MKTIDVGSSRFFEFKCDEDLVDRIIPNVKSLDYKKASVSQPNNISVGYEKVDDYNYRSFYDEELYNWLNQCLESVKNIYFTHYKLAICDLWAVEAKFGQSSVTHNHGFSLFSGLLYLTDCNRSETVFTYDDHFSSKYGFLFAELIKQEKREFKIKPEKGKLIIWPSDFIHHVSPHTDKKTRYTIAFNTFLEGKSPISTSGRLTLNVGKSHEETFTHLDFKPF